MILLTSRRIFALSLMALLSLGGCKQNDPANFPDVADFPKEPIIVPSPEAQKKQQAVLRAAFTQGDMGLANPDIPDVIARVPASCWPDQSQAIIRQVLDLMEMAPGLPIMIYLSGSKADHLNMLAWGARIENDFVCQGVPTDQLVLIIDFCSPGQEIQIQFTLATPEETLPVELDRQEETANDVDNGS